MSQLQKDFLVNVENLFIFKATADLFGYEIHVVEI